MITEHAEKIWATESTEDTEKTSATESTERTEKTPATESTENTEKTSVRLLALALLLLLGACSKPDDGPQPIALGEDDCGLCKMIISEQNYAAQARFDGKNEKYDDIGCLGERLGGAAQPQAMWVAEQPTGRWIDARSAFYVHAPELKTPMASGLAAFADRAKAEQFATEKKGRVLTLEDVRAMRRPQ